ncbi:MAG: DUF2357 domain-containing protein [Desulfovibrionaceae bacterium]|nr:DUF2357 domain-containing protein [Desulfovibrionaceae bacterium]
MGSLSIIEEQTGSEWQVWPDSYPIPAGAIRETGSYLFELKAEGALDADLLIDDVPLEALRSKDSNTSRWRWSPGFHAGTVEAELRLPYLGVRRFEVITDPDLRKLTRSDFDQMVREVLEDTFSLFALSGFRKTVARGVGGRPPAIARLEFLRSRVAELEKVAECIASRPRQKLISEVVPLPYYRAFRATGQEIVRSFQSGLIMPEVGRPSRLPVSLKGFLPRTIKLQNRRNSLDLPEHRQMASCLRSWSSWLSASADLLDRSKQSTDPEERRQGNVWSGRCRRLARRIGILTKLPPFAESGEAPPQLMLSAIMRNDPVYRRFYKIYQDMNLGIAAVFGDFLAMPLARTFDLYELWCFLRLVRAAVDEYGPAGLDVKELFATDASGGLTLATRSVVVAVGPGLKLCFQKQYREFWLEQNRQGSYSRLMVPDVVIAQQTREDSAPSRLIILDAKYRIEDGLNDALNSIHTYRDALVKEADNGKTEGIVTAAYLLSPCVPEFEKSTAYRDTPMPSRLFHPEYRNDFKFGAVTLRPGMSASELCSVVKLIVADATS